MPTTNHQQRSDALEKKAGSDDARVITSYADECEVRLNDEPRPRPVPVSSSNRRRRGNKKKNSGQQYHFDLCLEEALSVSDVSMDDDFFEDWLSLGDLEVDQLFGGEDDHGLDRFTLLAIDMALTIHNDFETYSGSREDEAPALVKEDDEENQYQCNKKTRLHRSRRTVPTSEMSDDGDDEGSKDSLHLSRRKQRSKRSTRKSKRSNREKKIEDESKRTRSDSLSQRTCDFSSIEEKVTGTKRRRARS